MAGINRKHTGEREGVLDLYPERWVMAINRLD